jgi:hypothetical protein
MLTWRRERGGGRGRAEYVDDVGNDDDLHDVDIVRVDPAETKHGANTENA